MLEWTLSEWKNINIEWTSLFITHTFTHRGTWVGQEKLSQVWEKEQVAEIIFSIFRFYSCHWFSFYLWGSCGVFPFMVSLRKILCVSCLLCLFLFMLFFQIMLAWMIKNITTFVFLKTPKEMFDSLTNLFEGENINRKMNLKKWLKNVKIQNAKIVITTLNGLLGSWDSFIQGMCTRRKWLPSADTGKSAHKKKLDS